MPLLLRHIFHSEVDQTRGSCPPLVFVVGAFVFCSYMGEQSHRLRPALVPSLGTCRVKE
jgi:hypothetical protein